MFVVWRIVICFVLYTHRWCWLVIVCVFLYVWLRIAGGISGRGGGGGDSLFVVSEGSVFEVSTLYVT